MSALPSIALLDCRPLTRPQFVVTEFALNSLANFVGVNYEALINWYDALAKEIEGTSDAMSSPSEFVALQFDLERARKGLPLIRAARAIDAKYAPEIERHRSSDERAANDAGCKCTGEI